MIMGKPGKAAKLIIDAKYVNRYRNGYPVLLKEAVLNPEVLKEEGQLIRLYDERNAFIAIGYYGIQNKGLGWVMTQDETAVIDLQYFKNLLIKAIGLRKTFFESYETTAFRVFNGEGDGLGGLIIDYYDGYYVINYYSQGIYAFKATLMQALSEVTGFMGVYQKKRFDTAGKYIEENDFVTGFEAPEPLLVLENGVKFATYLNDGAMTGVFLDQRPVRQLIKTRYAKGKTVLNTFSYTGAFSVFAALGGALKTTSVDLANRSLSKTIEQFEVNGIDPQAQEIIVEDVFHYFKYALRNGLAYGMVVLDPPSYATSKHFTFSAEKDYTNLLKEAIAITEDKGIIVASTNCSAFDMTKFMGFIERAFDETNHPYEVLETFTLPEDFRTLDHYREGDYLKVVFLRKLSPKS